MAKASNPFKPGDKVRLRHDVLERHSRSVPAHAGFTTQQFEWRKCLEELLGKTGTIERLFPNSKHVNVEYGEDAHNLMIGIDWTELEAV